TEIIFTVLHAGGKFGQGGYKASGGLHGVGAAVVNALSEWLTVTTSRNGERFSQHFKNGGTPVTSLEKLGKTNKSGTTIQFKPDSNIFSNASSYSYTSSTCVCSSFKNHFKRRTYTGGRGV